MAKKSPEQLQKEHREAIAGNEAIGIIDYNPGPHLQKSEEVWQVQDGKIVLPDGQRLGPGNRWHPTTKQVEQSRERRGGLRNNARELTPSELAGITRSRDPGRKIVSTGADFREMERRAELSGFEMAAGTMDLALESGLTMAEFQGTEPEGAHDRYTRAQVEGMIAARPEPAA